MLSKKCVKAALLLIPPGAAAHPFSLPYVCLPSADAVDLHLSGWSWLCPYSALLDGTRAKHITALACMASGHPHCSPVGQPH